MGRNGMGKTTLLRSVLGLLPVREGRVLLRGEDITHAAPHRIARAGIAYVPEGRGIFPNLSVRENLVMAARAGADGRRDWMLERVLATFPRLAERLDFGGQQLSGGEQQMLTIGRALMTNPDVLILDEATEGLAPLIAREIWAILGRLRESGISAVIVDKNLAAVSGDRRPRRGPGQGWRGFRRRSCRPARRSRSSAATPRRSDSDFTTGTSEAPAWVNIVETHNLAHSVDFLQAGGHRLEYQKHVPAGLSAADAATRPTLVFLHEGLGSVGLWKQFPQQVAEAAGCPALVYSRYGYGKSERAQDAARRGLYASRGPRCAARSTRPASVSTSRFWSATAMAPRLR